MIAIRPRRSVLYMPGSNARAIEKSRGLNCDAVILDLEDAVAPDEKDSARRQVCDAVLKDGFGRREVVIRVNAAGTPWAERDLSAAGRARPDAILLPKVSDPQVLLAAGAALTQAGVPDTVRLWAMIETPLAILSAYAIAAVARDPAARLACFVLGTNDLAKETRARAMPGRLPMLSWLSTAIAAARSCEIDVLDGVYNDLADAPGYRAECEQGRDPRLRRQDADPPQPDRGGQRRLCAAPGRGRAGQGGDRRFRTPRECRARRHHARRPHG